MSNRIADIRPAVHDDLFGIRDALEYGRTIAGRELPEGEFPFFLQYTLDLIAQKLVFVAVVGNDVVGIIAADWAHWPWNRKSLFLDCKQFFVQPAFRKGAAASKLLTAMKERARELNMPLQLSITYPDGAEEYKDRFLKMQGFEYTGGNFWCK